jgi:hypothetical protein
MTLQELQNQALQLPIRDRWQLVRVLLESLKREANPEPKRGNLSRLRGIAKISAATGDADSQEDYAIYLTEKYQYVCAVVYGVDAIVTRDASGFVNAEIPIVFPEQLDTISSGE